MTQYMLSVHHDGTEDFESLSPEELQKVFSAVDDFNQAVKLDRDSYIAWTNEGLALEQLGEREKANAAFARAANLNQNYAPAREGMRRTLGKA